MNSRQLKVVILSHPTANANVRAAAYGLADAGLLKSFYTAIASFRGDWLDKLSSLEALSELKRRQFDSKIELYTHVNPWYEAGRILALKVGLQSLTKHETGIFSVDSIYANHDKWVAGNLKKIATSAKPSIYAYEDGAKYSFEAAKRAGLKCFYDLPIGYWRSAQILLKPEFEKWPEWASTLTGFKNSEAKLLKKDEELKLADHIFVASSFTAKTLADYPAQLARVSIIPYGFPPVNEVKEYSALRGPLKLLFVGGLSQRKGIANLFKAVEAFDKHVQLTVVGKKASQDCQALDNALAKHTWIPSLPHAEILKLMKAQDVLVFPSLFEGFGLVITEAMSQGTPVITTDRTVGPDLINHGDNGWIIEAGSTEAIQKAIEEILLKPEVISRVGLEATRTAQARPWSTYGEELAQAVMNL